MNKKGITLVEVIISIGLISVVMLFLFNLLIDMQYEEEHASFSKKNQLNRAAMIKEIQEDFMHLNLQKITKNGNTGRVEIVLEYATVAKIITVTPNAINYNNEESWDMADENASFDLAHIVITTSITNETCSTVFNANTNQNEQVCSSYQTIKLVIPVVNGEKENIQDDIELFYIRKVK